jgi:hypothetical protein
METKRKLLTAVSLLPTKVLMICNRCLKKGYSLRISVSPRLCGELYLHLYFVLKNLSYHRKRNKAPDCGLIASNKSSDDLQSLPKKGYSLRFSASPAPLR